MDEPTASLDPSTVQWVRGILQSYKEDYDGTILLASHDMTEVEQLCEKVILLRNGKLVEDDSPKSLLKKYDRQTLEEVFLDINREDRL